jgi:hypothetical protein
MSFCLEQKVSLAAGKYGPQTPGRMRSVQIPAHRGQSFRRIADSIPVIADSF